MLFRKVVVLLTLMCGSLPAFSKDVTDLFNVYKNSAGSILLDGISDDSNLPLGDQASWLNTATLQEKYQLNSQYDNYILSTSSLNAEVSRTNSIPIDYLAVEFYKVFEGEFDGLPGVDFFVWVDGLGGLVFTPHANLTISLLDVSELNGQLDLARLGLIVYLKDLNGDGVDDISIVDDESSYQFLGGGNGFSAGVSVNNTYVVAEIPAKLSVSSSGALTYQVPIEVPTGINGLQPSISLNYNSRAGNGVMGVGWSIGGLDMLHRCGSDYVHDKKVKPIILTDEDNICFNGQRVFGDRTELDYFNDIKEVSGGYEVRTKSGLIKTYTHTVDLGNTEYQWLVKSVKDRFNNEIIYEYENLNGLAYLSSVEYSSGKVVFSYLDNRKDGVVKYLAGHPLEVQKNLDSVQLFGGKNHNSLISNYEIAYASDDFQLSKNIHLEKIGFCAFHSDGLKQCKPNLVFNWQNNELAFEMKTKGAPTLNYTKDSQPLDWNGDGLKDLLVVSNNRIVVKLNDGNSLSETRGVINYDQNTRNIYSFVVGDFLNKGKDAILYRDVSYLRGIFHQKHRWRIRYDNLIYGLGDSFELPLTPAVSGVQAPFDAGMDPLSAPRPAVLDLDGDGVLDFLLPMDDGWYVSKYIKDEGYSVTNKVAALDTVSSIVYAGKNRDGNSLVYFLNTEKADSSSIYELKVLDSSGDVIKSTPTNIKVERSLLIDVNNDGLLDILTAETAEGAGLEKDKVLVVNISKGGEFADKVVTNINAIEILPLGRESMFPATHPSKTADVNNDGLSDVVYLSSGQYKCLISDGVDFSKIDLGIEYSEELLNPIDLDEQSNCSKTLESLNEINALVNEVVRRKQTSLKEYPGTNDRTGLREFFQETKEQSNDVDLLVIELEKLKKNLESEGSCYECNVGNIEKARLSFKRYLNILLNLSITTQNIYNNGINITLSYAYGTFRGSDAAHWGTDTDGYVSMVNALNYARCKKSSDAPAYKASIGSAGYHLDDFTGDGVVDLLQLSGESMADWIVWENKAKKNLVNNISTAVHDLSNKKSALNKEISIEYTTQALADSYSKAKDDYSLVVKDLTQAINIVSNVIVKDEIEGKVLSHSIYAYEGFKYHTQGRGFLGASKHTVENIITGTKSIVSFHQEFPYIGLKKKIETYIAGSEPSLVTLSEFDWGVKTAVVDVLDGTNVIKRNRYTPVMLASLNLAYDLDEKLISNKTVEYTNYDDYGNNLNNLTKLWGTDDFTVAGIPAAGYLHSEEINNIYPIDTENWIISNKSNSSRSVTGLNSNSNNLSFRDTSGRVINSAYQYYPNTLALKSTLTNLDATNSFTSWSSRNENGVVSDSGTSGTNFSSERLVVNEFLNNQYPSEIRSYGYNATKFIKYDPVLFKPTQITGFDGKTSHIDYDAFGREIETISGDGIVTTTRYISCEDNAACQRSPEASYKVTVDSGGLPSSEVYYDKLNREILSRAQLQFEQHWQSVETEYTTEGYLSRTSLPYLGTSPTDWTTYTNYDALGRVGLITRPDGGRTATDYSSVGGQQRIQVTETIKSADGASSTRVVQSFLDARGLLVKKTEAVDSDEEITIEFDYDAMGNRDWVQVGGNEKETTTSIFDNAGNLVQLNDPSTGISHYTYAANGDLLTLEDAKKQLLTYTYDLFSRPKSRQEGTGSRAKKTYWYYGNSPSCNDTNAPKTYQTYVGKVCREYSVFDFSSKYYRYDSRGNLAHTKSLVDNKTSNYYARYDKYNRLESEKLDSGITLNYSYQKGYLNAISHQEKPLWEASKEDGFGNVTAYNLGNELKGLKSYDPQSGRLVGLSVGLGSDANSIQSNEYKWNSDGTLQSRIWQEPTPQSETFAYDSQKRLTQVTNTSAIRYSRNYVYELNGNIKSKTEIAGNLAYGGNNAGPFAVSKAGDVSYHYDNNGNITLRDPDGAGAHAGHKIEYNYFNKPTSIEDEKGKTLFSYGADLSRYKQVRFDNGIEGQTTYYVNGGRVEKRYSPSENVLKQITYIGDFAQLTEYGTLEAYANNTQSQTWNYLHRDHLGSIEAITDEDGAIAVSDGKPQYFSYDAFGQSRTELGDISTRGYTDHEQLTESGLIHMNGRVYDPLISRFLSADIMVQAPEFSQSYNRYSYVWNNPLSLSDPSGYVVQAALIFTPEVIGFFSGIGLGYNLNFEINDGGGFRGGILDNPIQDFSSPPYIYVPHEGETYSIFTTPIVKSIVTAYIKYRSVVDSIFGSNPEGFQAAENTGATALISEDNRLSGSNRNHVNGSIGEHRGWYDSLDNNEVGIIAPGHVTAPGVDYATYDADEDRIILWDAKYRAPGGNYPSAVPVSKIPKWTAEVNEAIQRMPESRMKSNMENALKNNQVDAQIFRWPKK